MRIYANRSLASFLVMVTVASSFMELASAHSGTRELRSYSNRGDRARVREARLAREEQLARDARLAERLQRGSRPMSEAALSGEERPRRRRRDKFSLNKLVIDGGHGTWPARACLSDPTSYTIHGSRIAAQCCVPPSRNRPEQCRRSTIVLGLVEIRRARARSREPESQRSKSPESQRSKSPESQRTISPQRARDPNRQRNFTIHKVIMNECNC